MKRELLGFAFGVVVLFLIVYFSDIHEVSHTISNANLSFISLAFMFLLLSMFFKSFRWKIFLRSIGLNIPFHDAFSSFSAALFLSNIAPGKVFEPIRGYFVKLKFSCSFSKTISLVVTERALDVYVYILFSIISLQVIGEHLPAHTTFISILGMVFFFFLSSAILIILNSEKLTTKLFNLLSNIPIFKKIQKTLLNVSENFSNGFKQLRKSNFLIPILIITFIIWIIEGMIFYFSCRAIGILLSPLLFLGIPCFSILLGHLTFLPGGLGSIEAIMILFLTSMGFQVSKATASVLVYRFFVHLLENSTGAFILAQRYGFDALTNFLKSSFNKQS